ncbi:hypothetical protein L207DRAFT_508147 [Hyaloscypha variabilis F]|uniref:Uncharacterized protein n=1 Tax=Hyaloscypha variabilis (strain UAMH 11265 / GT02V1 / F) TaxID=1149755 RepID=A0A2J6S3B5_HYAVF|nr:hypothetical protein L207DRAFT_508147 [Hyaloscypha variabilis F]
MLRGTYTLAKLFICFVSGPDQERSQLCQTLARTRHHLVQCCGNFNDLSLLLKNFPLPFQPHTSGAPPTSRPARGERGMHPNLGSEYCGDFGFSHVPSSCRPFLHPAASRSSPDL